MKVFLTTSILLTGTSLLKATSVSERLDSLESRILGMETILQELSGKPSFHTNSERSQKVQLARYQIRKGDSYWSIARRHRTSVSALERANPGINHRKLSIGKMINIPGNTHSTPILTNNQSESYRVKQGDILGRISEAHGIRLHQLLGANPGINPRRLKIGTVLTIPGRQPSSPLTPPSQEKSSPAPQPVDAPLPKIEEIETRSSPFISEVEPFVPEIRELDLDDTSSVFEEPFLVTLKENLRLSEFAARHQTTVAKINELNKVDLNPEQMIREGSQLYTPSR